MPVGLKEQLEELARKQDLGWEESSKQLNTWKALHAYFKWKWESTTGQQSSPVHSQKRSPSSRTASKRNGKEARVADA